MALTLGINCYHANAAAALVRGGHVVAAVEEERFNRIKHSAGFPLDAIRYCLRQGGIDLREVDAIAVGMKPIDHVQEEILHILSGRPNSRPCEHPPTSKPISSSSAAATPTSRCSRASPWSHRRTLGSR